MKRRLFTKMALLSIAGCATRPTKVGGAIAHMKCEKTEQEGCIEFGVLNLRWNPYSPLMKGLDKPYQSQVERRERVLNLGPQMYKGYKEGVVDPSGNRAFTIFMWNVREVPDSHLAAYRLNERTLSKIEFGTGVKGVVPPRFDPIYNLGKPDKVYRVSASGHKPIGAALQVPWSMITEKTYVLVCAEDRLTVYPNRITAEEGLWLTPEYLKSVRARGWEYILLPFISKDTEVSTVKK